MNLSKTTTYLILISIFSINGCAQSQDSELKKELHNYLSVIHLKKGFSGEILVAKGENILFQEAVGLASIENQILLKENAKYRIASITKTFTGLLLAIAKEEGKLDFNDKVKKHINNLSPKFENITIYQLLTHTSGFPHNEGIKDYWLIKSKIQLDTKQVIEEINKLDLLFESGTKMKYSSLGYYLLATVLENVYNNSYQKIIQEKILRKTKMSETDIVNTINIVPKMTNGYHFIPDDSLVVAPYRNYSMLKGAGDLYSTSIDLLKWSNSFFENKLISENSKNVIFTPHKTEIENNTYGLGWFIDNGKLKKYYHGGGTWGYSSYLALYPKNKISIIILSNISTLPIKSIGRDIEKMVFNLPFEIPKINQEVASSLKYTKLYSGVYKSKTSEMKLKITDSGNKLFAQLGRNPAFQIYSKGENKYFAKKVEIEFTFQFKDNSKTELIINRQGQVFNFIKL